MSKHTPEPWAHRNGRIFQADHDVLTIANIARAFDGDYSPENARRIVACVNACAGFEVKTLESIAMTGETLLSRFELMKSENERLERQQNDLLAALSAASEKMKAAHESMFEQCLSNPVSNAWGKEINLSAINELQLAASRIDSAIAKIKGGEV